ncbi:MAG: peptide chain release factor H [Micropepsaceae bacterium]
MNSLILHITAGQGPMECEWVVWKLSTAFCKEALKAGCVCEPVELLTGPCTSVLLRVSGGAAETFVAARTGTIRWIGTSTFRPTHKRKNWFVGVSQISEAGEIPELNEKDVTYQTMRASGPGGQHVNKTESAVRAIHLPTGLTAVSQEQRSQQANKKVAQLKLSLLFQERREVQAAEGKASLWAEHHALERGNAVRVYEGADFKLKK